jgi:hypothetical protein
MMWRQVPREAGMGAEPERTVRSYRNRPNKVVHQAVGNRIGGPTLSIKAGDTAQGAKPEHAVRGHRDGSHPIVCQPVGGGVGRPILSVKV